MKVGGRDGGGQGGGGGGGGGDVGMPWRRRGSILGLGLRGSEGPAAYAAMRGMTISPKLGSLLLDSPLKFLSCWYISLLSSFQLIPVLQVDAGKVMFTPLRRRESGSGFGHNAGEGPRRGGGAALRLTWCVYV